MNMTYFLVSLIVAAAVAWFSDHYFRKQRTKKLLANTRQLLDTLSETAAGKTGTPPVQNSPEFSLTGEPIKIDTNTKKPLGIPNFVYLVDSDGATAGATTIVPRVEMLPEVLKMMLEHCEKNGTKNTTIKVSQLRVLPNDQGTELRTRAAMALRKALLALPLDKFPTRELLDGDDPKKNDIGETVFALTDAVLVAALNAQPDSGFNDGKIMSELRELCNKHGSMLTTQLDPTQDVPVDSISQVKTTVNDLLDQIKAKRSE